MHLSRSSSKAPCLPSLLDMLENPHVFSRFWQCAQSLALATRNNIWTSKRAPYPPVFWCALRHNGANFLNMSSSKSAPTLVCFVHFYFDTCFTPQLRALFRHLNFQKCSKHGVYWILTWTCASRHTGMQLFDIATSKSAPNMVYFEFWLGNVLRATPACNFSTSQLPKVLRRWRALYVLTSKCVSRHNSVQFFISHLPTWLRTLRFSEPTFQPSGATNHWKNTVNRDFPTFSCISIFFLLTLSLLLLSLLLFSSLTLLFHLSILSDPYPFSRGGPPKM